MDLQAIANAIATTVGSITANSETAVCSADLPNSIEKLALLVYPPVGDLEIGIARMRNDHYAFPVRLLRDPVDMPGRTRALYAWATVLRDSVEKNIDLDLAYVARASAMTMRIEIEGQEYASISGSRDLFDVVELIVDVYVREVVTTVSV